MTTTVEFCAHCGGALDEKEMGAAEELVCRKCQEPEAAEYCLPCSATCCPISFDPHDYDCE